MTLRDKAETNFLVSIFAAFFLVSVGLFSMIAFWEYRSSGELATELIFVPCMVFGVVTLVSLWGFTFPVFKVVLSQGNRTGRRAAYFQALFPILLISFLISTPQASFAPTFAFAFPLLFLGAVAYPYTAIVIHRWVKRSEMENLVIVECLRCSYVFEMHKTEEWMRCPYCGQVNMNPDMAEDTDVEGEGRKERPVSP
ncbi:MAG: hypothetical protein JSW25_08765 [Thermoplasmata archaeon]|nr:MAG: hypothetical protein JSW25_08765 [Thermoplasmata archaeon]